MNREQWLKAMADEFRSKFKVVGYPLPDNIRYSCGWTTRKKAIGQAHADVNSGDGHFEIFVSPQIGEASRAADILLHELVHVAVGLKEGHNKVFKACMKAVGLEGKATATIASPALKAELDAMIQKLGPYPHAELARGFATGPKKQSTRLLKVECPACGFLFRTTQKHLNQVAEEGATLRCPKSSCDGEITPSDDEE